ncbi:hypothetical protein AMTRI_Chr09g32480 [Amborella trichopoda]
MLVISWNSRGLGGARRRRQLHKLIDKCRPNVLLSQETKLKYMDVSFIITFWGSGPIDFAFSPSNGRSGGLLTKWDSFVILRYILDISFRFITMNFCGPDSFLWCLTNVYGPNAYGEKEEFLNSLSTIVSRVGIPWRGDGDFKMVR